MTTPAPGQVEAAEEMEALTGERRELPAIGEHFTARDRSGFSLRWEDGEFTTDWPPYLTAVNELIESKQWVSSFSTGPTAPAGSTPGWVALFTAQEALRMDELDWDESNVDFPRAVFGHPPGSVA